jgi:GDP-L-fucose synthase
LAGVVGDEAERAIDEKDGETGGDRLDEVGDDRLGAGRREGGDDGDDEEGGRRLGGGDGLAGGGAPIRSNSGARRPVVNDPKPAEFIYQNMMIEANVIEAAHRADVNRLLFLGSSCIYPKFAPQPITEDALLTGPLEPTNEAYAIAKIAGIKIAQAYRKQYSRDYIAAMPTNLYGPGDNFDLTTSHVLPALIRKADDARRKGHPELTIWGSGAPRREFLHVDDCADALVHLLKVYSGTEHVNVGSGEDISIRALAELVTKVVEFKGRVTTDLSKPDGTPRKLMSGARLAALGWRPRVGLEDGIRATYRWYLEQIAANDVPRGAARITAR